MYVKHLQEYLAKFTEGRNSMRGNAVSDAKIYIMTRKGYLEEIKRIEVHESNNHGHVSACGVEAKQGGEVDTSSWIY